MRLDLATRLDRFFPARPHRDPARCGHSLEILEARIAPAAMVTSIVRAGGAAPGTAAGSVAYTVTFSEAVSGVDATDFQVHTEGNAHATSAVTVAAVSTTVYTVTASGLHGQGDVRLDLIDNDSITGPSGVLGGAGVGNGSFQGAAYHLLQTFPKVSSITAIGSTTTNASSVSWTVTLSAAVTGVDATDFTLVKSGVNADPAVTVKPVSSTVYTVTATGVSGVGTLALKLVDDGTIRDARGNPLQGTLPPTFAAQASLATGNDPHAVAVADVNGDGRPDLVIANYSDETVSVLLGAGSGVFAPKTDFFAGTNPSSVAVADVNGDGQADLVTANAFSDTVSVLLGNGSGGFGVKTDFATGSTPLSVAVGDLNGDGRPDFVAANSNDDTVSVLPGTGVGTFTGDTFTVTAPDLQLIASQDITCEAAQGGTVHYTLHPSNIGSQDATGVILTEHLPANSSFNAAQSSNGWSHVGGDTYRLTVGNLDAGASAPSEVFAVTVNHPFPVAARTLSESASLADDGRNGADSNAANDSASLTTLVYKGIFATSTGITNPKTGPSGAVHVYDVNTGLPLLSFHPFGPKYHDSVRIATGDFNGDGFDDIVTSTRLGTGQVGLPHPARHRGLRGCDH